MTGPSTPGPAGWRARLADNPVLGPVLTLGAGSAAVALLSLVTGALTARLLGPEGRGDLLALTVYALIGSNLMVLGLDVALPRLYRRHGLARRDALAASFTAAALATLLAALVVAAAQALSGRHAVQLIAAHAPLFLAYFAASHLSILYQSLIVAGQDYRLYALLRVTMPAVTLAAVGLCFALGAGLGWVFAAFALGALLYPAVALRDLAASPREAGSRPDLSLALNYAAPAAGLQAARALETQSLGIAVTLFGTRAEAGLLATALVAASVVALLSEGLSRYAFGSALKAEIATAAEFRRWFRQLRGTALALLLLSLVAAGPLVWFLLPYVYGAEFAAGRALVLPLMAGSTLAALANIYAEIARAQGLARRAILPRLVSAAVVLAAVWAGVPGMGVLGALAAGFIAGQAAQLALLHLSLARHFRSPA